MAKELKDLTEREILALAISLEEDDSRIYGDFAEGLRETYPASARMLEEMQQQESEHRRSLFEIYRQRFGEHIPLLRREDVLFQVFGYNFEPGTNLVNVHIANLRKKLRGGPVVIEAVRGVGYRLRPREPGDA